MPTGDTNSSEHLVRYHSRLVVVMGMTSPAGDADTLCSLHGNFLKAQASRASGLHSFTSPRKSLLAGIFKYYAILGKQ